MIDSTAMKHALRIVAACIASCPFAVGATDVVVSGLFTNKALVQIDGGPLRTLAVGQSTPEGVRLVSVDRESAVFEIDGKRTTLGIGQAKIARGEPAIQSATLIADMTGHFSADGKVNGQPIRFMIDTGATITAIPAADARRLNIDVSKGQLVLLRTANGTARARQVKLDVVSVGGVTLYGVEAVVMEGDGLGMPLLGMSFLNRMDMKREGSVLTLTKRY